MGWHDRCIGPDRMRRALSISLILLFWLPAFAALMPGSEDVRLPWCCRRQGAHHCAMDSADRGASGPAFKAASRCAQFPGELPATLAPVFVAAAAPALRPVLVSSIDSPVARREAARAGRLRAQLDRGPPATSLA
jgi:hypothetical protein